MKRQVSQNERDDAERLLRFLLRGRADRRAKLPRKPPAVRGKDEATRQALESAWFSGYDGA